MNIQPDLPSSINFSELDCSVCGNKIGFCNHFNGEYDLVFSVTSLENPTPEQRIKMKRIEHAQNELASFFKRFHGYLVNPLLKIEAEFHLNSWIQKHKDLLIVHHGYVIKEDSTKMFVVFTSNGSIVSDIWKPI